MALGRDRVKFFEKPFVSWRNDVALFLGPRLAGYSAVDVEDLTTGSEHPTRAMGRRISANEAHLFCSGRLLSRSQHRERGCGAGRLLRVLRLRYGAPSPVLQLH
jgi:hypothetical protein